MFSNHILLTTTVHVASICIFLFSDFFNQSGEKQINLKTPKPVKAILVYSCLSALAIMHEERKQWPSKIVRK
jgi:hypothetical protein